MSDELSSKKGFTLVEIMTAAVIMAVTIGGIFSVFAAGNKFVSRSSRRLAAVSLIQQEIEKRRVHVRFDTWTAANDGTNLGITVGTGSGWWPSDGSWIGNENALIPEAYRYRVDWDPHFANPVGTAAACRQVYMQVGWNE